MTVPARVVTEVTDAQDTILREEIDSVLFAPRGSNNPQVMHIPNGDGRPMCERPRNKQEQEAGEPIKDSWKEKPMAVYPKGHKRFCEYCAYIKL